MRFLVFQHRKFIITQDREYAYQISAFYVFGFWRYSHQCVNACSLSVAQAVFYGWVYHFYESCMVWCCNTVVIESKNKKWKLDKLILMSEWISANPTVSPLLSSQIRSPGSQWLWEDNPPLLYCRQAKAQLGRNLGAGRQTGFQRIGSTRTPNWVYASGNYLY